jgi:hypothetical protein
VDTCRRPSSANRLPNAGFDRGLTAWRTETGKARHVKEDVEGCATSGSIAFDPNEPDTILSECVSVQGGDTYNFGARVKLPRTVLVAGCELRLRTGPGCTIIAPGDSSRSVLIDSLDREDWHAIETSVQLAPDIVTAQVNCGPGGSGGTGTVYIDQVFLTKAPGRF